jgi:predicted nucleotidyltransferase
MQQVIDAHRQRLASIRAAHRQEAERLAHQLADDGVSKVILFGSVAERRDSFGSDIDLAAISDAVAGVPFNQRTADAMLKLRPAFKTDLLIYTPDEWNDLCASRRFVKDEMLNKGVVLFERYG